MRFQIAPNPKAVLAASVYFIVTYLQIRGAPESAATYALRALRVSLVSPSLTV
jgi:hypothetical protein